MTTGSSGHDDKVSRAASTDRRTDPRVLRSRAAVLGATLDLLAERGIGGTTVEAISERCGVAKTTIYRQWNGQAALVLDAFGSIVRPPRDPDTGTHRAVSAGVVEPDFAERVVDRVLAGYRAGVVT